MSKITLFLDKMAMFSVDFVQIIHYFGQNAWFLAGDCPKYHFFWTKTNETH